MTYHQEVILAMELDRRHIGKLVQMITDSWSMTGTLKRVDQHDNREWEIAYPSRQLVPARGEIYTTLHIGPWVGDVIGNQPVTVETVVGTLEAPETATKALPNLITPEESAEARGVIEASKWEAAYPPIEGTVVEPPCQHCGWTEGHRGDCPYADPWPVHRLDDLTRDRTRCGLKFPPMLAITQTDGDVTCRECLAWEDADPLPPEPPADWHKR